MFKKSSRIIEVKLRYLTESLCLHISFRSNDGVNEETTVNESNQLCIDC